MKVGGVLKKRVGRAAFKRMVLAWIAFQMQRGQSTQRNSRGISAPSLKFDPKSRDSSHKSDFKQVLLLSE
jgi:hypothetical protein